MKWELYVPFSKGGRFINPFKDVAGCYILTHLPTGRFYVGSTDNLPRRVSQHITTLKYRTHTNRKLLEVYVLGDKLQIEVSRCVGISEAAKLEQCVVDKHVDDPLLCNIAIKDVTKSSYGLPVTQERRAHLRKLNLGNVVTSETREKLRLANIGKTLTPEHRVKIGDSNKLRYTTPDGKRTIAVAQRIATEATLKPIQIGEDIYLSGCDAARALNVSSTTIYYRLNRPKQYPDYRRIIQNTEV